MSNINVRGNDSKETFAVTYKTLESVQNLVLDLK